VVNDGLANQLLKSKSLGWHSANAELYWKQEYLRAWAEHPRHVLQTILFRMNLISTKCEYEIGPLLGMCDIVYCRFAWATLAAIVWLLWKRRWPEAFLIAGPMVFALLSLGFVYVELRYVRYAGLSYLLGFPVLVALVAEFLARHFRTLDRFGGARSIKAAIGAAGVVAVAVYFAGQQPLLGKAVSLTLIARDPDQVNRNAAHPDITIQSLALEPVIAAVSTTSGPEGLDVRAVAPNFSYLLMAALNPGNADAVTIGYRIKLIEGDVNLGLLSGDENRFLGSRNLSGPPDSVHSSRFLSVAESTNKLVVSALNPTEQWSRFQIQDLQINFLCQEKRFEFAPLYLFGRQSPRINSCNQPAPRQ
jgi:hypothetical protein